MKLSLLTVDHLARTSMKNEARLETTLNIEILNAHCGVELTRRRVCLRVVTITYIIHFAVPLFCVCEQQSSAYSCNVYATAANVMLSVMINRSNM
ncbi:hypothetical protein T05_2467 [Trichinella murrelli]|uniref:Uncharacterized protein n=1 Tax=Trichinella murrelli TaxID=144512 RepID=A0A0V0TAR7_9BILA|nr:hypothetical protein T05_15575 [Trichinella murrelli]KRX35687.1 hypothetical protein T05_2467 [Trichinella murrelli]